jgi:hypothetical protein
MYEIYVYMGWIWAFCCEIYVGRKQFPYTSPGAHLSLCLQLDVGLEGLNLWRTKIQVFAWVGSRSDQKSWRAVDYSFHTGVVWILYFRRWYVSKFCNVGIKILNRTWLSIYCMYSKLKNCWKMKQKIIILFIHTV